MFPKKLTYNSAKSSDANVTSCYTPQFYCTALEAIQLQ